MENSTKSRKIESLTIENKTLINLDLQSYLLEDITFKNCDLSFTNFNNSSFKNVTFINCDLSFCTFEMVNCNQNDSDFDDEVIFEKCNLPIDEEEIEDEEFDNLIEEKNSIKANFSLYILNKVANK